MKPPLAELRKSKRNLSAYIDDIYLQDDTKENCIKYIIDTATLLRSLGFTVHAEKSQFLPTQELDILGFTINSVNMTVLLKKEKKEQLACLIRKTINKKFIKIRKLAQIIGKIVAALPGSRFGALYYRGLEKNKQHGLQKSKFNYEAYVELFQESITELNWWRENLPNMFNKIGEDPPTVRIYSDASDTGWGAHFQGRNTWGNWSLEEKYYHINVKEMLAVYFSLKCFAKDVSNLTLTIHIDNTAVVSILKSMGTSHNELLNKKRKLTWEWCKSKNIWLFPVYVNTKHNLADESSRKIYSQGEWMLAKTIFSKVLKFNITPKIDLFASRLNNQLLTYVSYKPDPNAYTVDAFSLDWNKLHFYAFPPFSCISQCIQKIKTDKAEGILVIPHWPTQPFYSKIMKMAKGLPVIIPANAEKLVHPNGLKSLSTVAAKTDLMVCHVSGRDF